MPPPRLAHPNDVGVIHEPRGAGGIVVGDGLLRGTRSGAGTWGFDHKFERAELRGCKCATAYKAGHFPPCVQGMWAESASQTLLTRERTTSPQLSAPP